MFTAKYVTKNGTIFWGEVHYKLYYDRDDQFTGSLGTMSDITERKEAEDELIEINERLARNPRNYQSQVNLPPVLLMRSETL